MNASASQESVEVPSEAPLAAEDPPADPAWAARIASIEQAPDDAAAWSALDAARADAGSDLDRWFDLARQAQRRDLLQRWSDHLSGMTPTVERDARPWIGLAGAQAVGKLFSDAHASLRRARDVADPPSSELHGQVIAVGFLARQWGELLADLDRLESAAAAAEPDAELVPWLAVHRAVVLGHLGRLDEAMAAIDGLTLPPQAASRLGRAVGEAALEWTQGLLAAGRFAEALRVSALMRGWDVPRGIGEAAQIVQMTALLRLERFGELEEPAQQLQQQADDAPTRAVAAFFDAVAQEAHGRADAALERARQALAAVDDESIPPTFGPLMRLVAARALITLDRAQEALPLLDRSVALGDDPAAMPEVQLQRARALQATAKHEESLQALDLALAAGLDPRRRPTEQWVRGNALAALGRHALARDAYSQAARLGTTGQERCLAWLMAAQAARAASDDAGVQAAAREAAREADELARAEPGHPQVQEWWTSAQMHLALAAHRMQQPKDAVAALDALHERLPGADEAILWQVIRVESLLALERFDAVASAAAAALAIQALAGHPYLLYLMADAKQREGDGVAALQARQAGAGELPATLSADPYAHLGQLACNMALARFAEAQAARDRLIEMAPAFAEHPIVRMAGIVARMRGQDNPSAQRDLAELDEFIAKVPRLRATLAMGRGILLLQAGQLDEARAVFEEIAAAASLDPSLPEGARIQARLLRFRVLSQQGRLDEAVELLREIDAQTATDMLGRAMQAMGRLTLAAVEAAGGRAEEALQVARRAEAVLAGMSEEPGSSDGFWTSFREQSRLQQADALLQTGRPEEARALLDATAAGEGSRGHALALHLRSLCDASVEDWLAAVATARRFRAALARLPDRAELHTLVIDSLVEEAEAHLRLQAWPAAVQVLEQALAEPGDEAAKRARLWWRLGRAYGGMERLQAARQAMRRSQALLATAKRASNPLRRAVADSLAAIELLTDDPAAALNTLDAAGREAPPGALALYNRGVALLALYRREADEALLDQARETFVRARQAGHEGAAKVARQIARREVREGGWPAYWFGADARGGRRALGAALALAAMALIFAPPAWTLWSTQSLDWKLLAAPTVAVLALLLLPGLKNLSLQWGEAKFSAEPMAAPDASTSVSIPIPLPNASQVFMQGAERATSVFGLDTLVTSFDATFADDLARKAVTDMHLGAANLGMQVQPAKRADGRAD